MRLITAIRNFRLRNGVAPKLRVDLLLRASDHRDVFNDCRPVVQRLTNVSFVESDHLAGDTIQDDAFEVVVSIPPS